MLFDEYGLPTEYKDTLRMADPPENIQQLLQKMWIEIVRKHQQLLYNTIGEKTCIWDSDVCPERTYPYEEKRHTGGVFCVTFLFDG